MMNISEKGLNLIKEFEGCILQSYDDYNDKVICSGETPRGTLTIGWGHIEGVYAGQVITQEEADNMLIEDMSKKYCSIVNEYANNGIINFALNQNMFDALSSFCYNCGGGSLRTLCQNRNLDTVANMMLEYRNKGSIWEKGLLRRRTAERELFLSSDVQTVATSAINNIYIELQKLIGVSTDGMPGPITLAACPVVKEGSTGDIVKWIQLRVGANADGCFGPNTKQAIMYYQKAVGIEADGIVGQQTWSKILKLN